MNVTIYPSTPIGSVAAPPSKSMAHRALICAGLAQGESTVYGIAPSQDVLATMDCLTALGASVEVCSGVAKVRGMDPAQAQRAILSCRESGSTLRFFIPLCLLSGNEMTLQGSPTLLSRPLSVYETLFQARGLRFEKGSQSLSIKGRLPHGEYMLDGNVSSQFVSGLLFALPLLSGDSLIRLRPPVESRCYIDMTLDTLREFGIAANWTDETTIAISGNQKYQAREIAVEGDWSNAAFFLAMGAQVTGLNPNSRQGDSVCTSYFQALDERCATLDLSDCPDLGPVLFAYAALRHGGVFTGTRRLRIKESDRGAAMQQELKKFGVAVQVEENTVTVGDSVRTPTGPLDGHNDHRIVMALSVLCAKTGGTIAGAEAVSKSFPDFFERLLSLGVKIDRGGNPV